MANKKALFLIVFSLVLIVSFSSYSIFSGHVISTTSSVGVDPGIKVLADTFDGDTTHFIAIDDAGLAYLSGMVLEKSLYGKILVESPIDLTQDAINNVVDIDSHVVITSNYFKISGLDSLENASMILYIYIPITFNNPRVIRNAQVCPSTICTSLYSIEGHWLIHVNGDGEYYLQDYVVATGEGTTTVDGSSSGSYTGSGSSTASGSGYLSSSDSGGHDLEPEFTVNKESLNVEVLQGEFANKKLMVYNKGHKNLNLTLNISESIKDYLIVDLEDFDLTSQGSKALNLDFFAAENATPEVHTGRITISDGNTEKIINVIIEVKSKKALFDVKASPYSNYLRPGETIYSNIRILNMGDINNMDINVYYDIRDYDGKIYAFKEEMIAIDDKLSLERFLGIPENIPYGDYVFYVKVNYGDVMATSAYGFKVGEGIKFLLRPKFWVWVLAIILAMIIVGIFVQKRKEENKIRRSIIQMEALASFDEDAEEEDDKKDSEDGGGKEEGSEDKKEEKSEGKKEDASKE